MNQRNELRARAEAVAAQRLAAMAGPSIFRSYPSTYTRRPEENLIPGVAVTDFWADLEAGAGNELVDGANEPAKFCAAFSSSALAVNSFGPFRHQPENLELVGVGGFSAAQFEKPLPTGLPGTDPHLDFFCAGPAGLVCVESKFLEPLWPKKAHFAASYASAVRSVAEPAWVTVFQTLKDDPQRFQYLDAAQLVKHYLGMRHSLAEVSTPKALLYVYWEPENADQIGAFREHRDEVACFAELVSGSRIEFVTRSYRRLWQEWAQTARWSGLLEHVSNLQQRYAFSL